MTADIKPESLIDALREPMAKLIEAKKQSIISPKAGSEALASVFGSKASANGSVPGSMVASLLTSKDGPVLNQGIGSALPKSPRINKVTKPKKAGPRPGQAANAADTSGAPSAVPVLRMAARMDRVEQFLEGKFCFLTMLNQSGDGSLGFGKQKTMLGQRQSGAQPGGKGGKLGQNSLGSSFNKARAGGAER